ncbi:hypothetical protein JTB14_030666 [Gonioctena quinquepunctata]|nr:hypothetical protein JTB14_030666 [Gonioctena quinquepunctata]
MQFRDRTHSANVPRKQEGKTGNKINSKKVGRAIKIKGTVEEQVEKKVEITTNMATGSIQTQNDTRSISTQESPESIEEELEAARNRTGEKIKCGQGLQHTGRNP